jgi:heme/copper-type cytochrome/quinol oxidase subunit 2|tara:strand:- start:752 stop:949 length:198 start_codon:yes stop_codon:yes gene_type:complete
MVELILLLILVTIGILWFRNLSDNSEKGNDEVEGNLKVNKWGTYISIALVSGFFVWLLITNGNFN